MIKFSILYNTASDIVKAVTTTVPVATGAYALANADGVVTGVEWTVIVGTVVAAFLTALGFYSKTDEPTTEAPKESPQS